MNKNKNKNAKQIKETLETINKYNNMNNLNKKTKNKKKKALTINTVPQIILLLLGIILISIIITAIIFLSMFFVSYLLSLGFKSNDYYILSNIASYIYGILALIGIPLIIFLLLVKKNTRLEFIKNSLTKHTILSIFISLIFFMLIFSLISGINTNYKDLLVGKQTAIMTDAKVKVNYHYKRNRHYYIAGKIDGKEVKLELVSNARKKVKKGEMYRLVNIKYYKNIKEVTDLDILVQYVKKDNDK